jgi:hypothetical protein
MANSHERGTPCSFFSAVHFGFLIYYAYDILLMSGRLENGRELLRGSPLVGEVRGHGVLSISVLGSLRAHDMDSCELG